MRRFFTRREKTAGALVRASSAEAESLSLASVQPHLRPLLAPEAFEAEPYRVLAHLITQLRQDAGLRLLAISSPSMGDGKTSTVIALASILARELDVRVLLVEAELRRPSIAAYLGIQPVGPGLGEAILKPALALEQVAQPYPPCGFNMVLAHRSLASPYDVLKLPRFGALLQEARRDYDYVIVDTPPLLPFADCRIVERWVDGLLVVVAAHQTSRKLLAEALDITDPTKLVGLVLNKDNRQAQRYHEAYRYYTQPRQRL